METIILPLVAALCIMAISLIGVVTTYRSWGSYITTNISYFVSFGAGVFLFTAGFLGYEAFELLPGWVAVVVIMTGYLIASTLVSLVPWFHHHHDGHCDQPHTKSGRRILVGDGIHNVADGLMLVPAFAVSPVLGLGVAVSIAIHESIQELSEFLVLRTFGYTARQALLRNLLTSSTILIGVGVGFFVAQTVFLQGILLGLSAGFFINIVIADLLPHVHHKTTDWSQQLFKIGLVFIGALLMWSINAFGHNHDHSHDHGGEYEDATETDHGHTHDEESGHSHDPFDQIFGTDSHTTEDHSHDHEETGHQETGHIQENGSPESHADAEHHDEDEHEHDTIDTHDDHH